MKPLLDRGVGGKVGGCLAMLVVLAIQLVLGAAVTFAVGAVIAMVLGAPSVAGISDWRSVVGLLIGLIIAYFPVRWIERTARRLIGYGPMQALGELPPFP